MTVFNKWTGLRLEITQYCQGNNISENDFRFLGIYECNPSVVYRIIDVNPTDYYITNKKIDWLITEDHHDIVQFIGKGLDTDIIKSVCTK